MAVRSALLCFIAAALTATRAWAGGSGLNVAVVVNQNSSNSVQLANLYCELRGVPPQNVLNLGHVWSGGPVNCTADELQTSLVAPLMAMLQSRGLTNQIQYVLLSMDIPYRVFGTNGINSTTSALFYGFKPDTSPPPGVPASCSLPDNSSNSYAFSEAAFVDAPPDTAATNSFLTVMLTATNLAYAEMTLSNGVAADGAFPAQSIYLEKTDDPFRNVRFYEFDNAVFDEQVHDDFAVTRIASDSTSFTNLLGLQTGLTTFSVSTNAFAPGAIADNLTSFGGYILEPDGQTPLLEFLDGGATASYGTVVEPCNYLQKFPNPLDYFYQRRGFSIAEAYYQSVLNPYQGLMVGEPLSAPFAIHGTGAWQLPPGTPVLSGTTNLQVNFIAASANAPLAKVDLFVDGTWLETITNIPPNPGDDLTVTLNGSPVSYIVPANATVPAVTAGLAAALNSASNSTMVAAAPYGDRIILRSLNPALPGGDLPATATVANHSMPPTTFASCALPAFLDSIAIGYHNILVSNTPSIGSWLQLQIVETNGSVYNFGATNTTSGETIGQLMQALYNDILGSVPMTYPTGIQPGDFDDETAYGFADFNIYARSAGWPASAIQVTFTASPDLAVQAPATTLLQDNLSDLQARNHLYIASGRTNLSASWALNTMQLPDGYHQLTAVAYDGTSVRTQTRATQNVLIQNTTLTATLNTVYGGSNTDIGATLQFSVAANGGTVQTIELFSTGGSLGVVTNQNPASFAIPGATLGLGLHPFYAIVTAGNGQQYRTATTWIRLIGPEPPLALVVDNHPVTLAWTATAGRTYEIEASTNLAGPFTNYATVTPSNSTATWVVPTNGSQQQYFLLKASY